MKTIMPPTRVTVIPSTAAMFPGLFAKATMISAAQELGKSPSTAFTRPAVPGSRSTMRRSPLTRL